MQLYNCKNQLKQRLIKTTKKGNGHSGLMEYSSKNELIKNRKMNEKKIKFLN